MPETNAFVASIYRKGKPFVPDGDTVIRESDEVYFISSSAVSYTHLTLPTIYSV